METLNKLDEKELKAIKDNLKPFIDLEQSIKDYRDSQKEIISRVAKRIGSLSKKDVKKLFNYFKKGIEPGELIEEAELLAEIKEAANG